MLTTSPMITPIEQIGEHDRHDRDHIRQEAIPAFVPHRADDLRTGELEARDHQNRRQARQRNAIEQRRQTRRCRASSKMPWKIAERLVCAPALMLTELRTMTDVSGMPPIRPATQLPTP